MTIGAAPVDLERAREPKKVADFDQRYCLASVMRAKSKAGLDEIHASRVSSTQPHFRK